VSRILIVGGGIVGLSVARALLMRGREVLVLEKEPATGLHQTGRSSGVIHSGLYYKPGSLKARFAREGAEALFRYAREHGVAARRTGKLVVATCEQELPRLRALRDRGEANGRRGLDLLSPEQAREIEPHVRTVGALYVPQTGVCDFIDVARALEREVRARGAKVWTSCSFEGARPVGGEGGPGGLSCRTSRGPIVAAGLVTCAGLFGDRVARTAGATPSARIVPFRGEYFRLRSPMAERVRGLVYPVPDPSLPFLGVHLTRRVSGEVEVGPNAVLALRREGYRWGEASLSDLFDVATTPGFLSLARTQLRTGVREVVRSFSPRIFARDVARLLPGVRPEHLAPRPAGVRAQAIAPSGALLDDFDLAFGHRAVHVISAPSPGATACLPIGEYVAEGLLERVSIPREGG
jgi:L-2-hydroxyglutarate oxidase